MQKKTMGWLALVMAVCAGSAVLQQNNAPVIKVIAPKAVGTQPLNTLLPFEILVSDKEDGDSRYGEINGDEVHLSVRYLADATRTADVLRGLAVPDPEGFVLLQKSNCINCHAFQGPLIAPSFADIARRYPSNRANEVLLSKRIVAGSSGIWGGTPMPSHPELSQAQAEKIVQWLLPAGLDTKTQYYHGLTGTLKLTIPKGEKPGGLFILRASYADHGVEGQGAIQGADVAIVVGK